MAGRTKDKELAVIDAEKAEELLRFNRGSKQRIVDACNEDLADNASDILDEKKNYSSWNRALNGNEVWEGIVEDLDGLWSEQISRPFEHISEPGDDFHEWMKDFAKADWWWTVLQPDMSQSTFKAWYSGRDIAQKSRDALKAKFDEWWERLQAALDSARDYTEWARAFDRDGEKWSCEDRDGVLRNTRGVDQLLYRMIVEDKTLAREDAAEFVCEKYKRRHCGALKMIDPADPQDPFYWGDWVGEFVRDSIGWEFQGRAHDILCQDFPLAVSTMPPDGLWVQPATTFESQWGGLREEEGTTTKNRELWGLWYRVEVSPREWDRDEIAYVGGDLTIVAVSEDGEVWREPDEREAQGWLRGTTEFLEALVQYKPTSTPYEQEQDRHQWAKRLASGRADSQLRKLEDNLRKAQERGDAKIAARLQAELDLVQTYL